MWCWETSFRSNQDDRSCHGSVLWCLSVSGTQHDLRDDARQSLSGGGRGSCRFLRTRTLILGRMQAQLYRQQAANGGGLAGTL